MAKMTQIMRRKHQHRRNHGEAASATINGGSCNENQARKHQQQQMAK